MSNVAIRVDGLDKMYRIGGPQERYRTLRDSITDAVSAPFRRAISLLHGQAYGAAGLYETIWALRNVSFEVQQGEVVGIIGRNGAGKSTLLKILSRITEPTTGYADLYGRVGALLEVGTGFHQELTGRENIYLNGAILGMSRDEISRKFDEIVAFAEVEKFIDTPVKHYSSGMGLRLGFAVAAHLEPEILIVDEVLAVGDIEFQRKCLGRMSEISQQGRTVLFVSHNMAAVQGLCQSAIVLDAGSIAFQGSARDGIRFYLQSHSPKNQGFLSERKDRKGNQRLKFVDISIIDHEGNAVNKIISGQNYRFRFFYVTDNAVKNVVIHAAFNVSFQGVILTNLNSEDTGNNIWDLQSKGFFECEWKKLNLIRGIYQCTLFCSINGQIADWIESAFELEVESGDFYETGKLIERQGNVLITHSWSNFAI